MAITDFQGLLSLDKAVVSQLREYLDTKEGKVADALLFSLMAPTGSSFPVLSSSGHLRLSQAIDLFINRIRLINEEEVHPDEWKLAADQLNGVFWDYAEILEETSLELFQQVDQISFDRWTLQLYETVEALKELLLHRTEDLMWAIRRVEAGLLSYRAICGHKKNLWMLFGRFLSHFTYILDKNLPKALFKTEEFLNTHFKVFKTRFEAFRSLDAKVGQSIQKFYGYWGWNELDLHEQTEFLHLYGIIKIWEENRKDELLPPEDVMRVVKSSLSPGKGLALFKNYLSGIKKTLFRFSHDWKEHKDPLMVEKIKALQNELTNVGATVSNFRELILANDPNPYTRTRLGFTEWVVGPEPRKTRELLDVVYYAEKLKKWSEIFLASVEKSLTNGVQNKHSYLKKEIEEIIREMGQPLSSRSLQQSRSEQLMDLLEECDELGGSQGEMTTWLTPILIKALRMDWRYQVLPEQPRFRNFIEIHLALTEEGEDRLHLGRIARFKKILNHLEQWAKRHETDSHMQEIDTDVTDVKEALQDSLARLQHLSFKNKSFTDSEYRSYTRQLLELRYLFDHFFYRLRQYEPDGKQLRIQFLFADQYLEAMELVINEMAAQKNPH